MSTSKNFKLPSFTELRIEIEDKYLAIVQLKSGTAEIFGNELVLDKNFIIKPGSKIAIFTWHGCTLNLNCSLIETDSDKNTIDIDSFAYISKETPNIIYTNVHAILEKMRKSAENKDSQGPRVMVTGPNDVGKTTLCLLLANYAIRLGWKPVYVDLDVGQGSITIPGNLGAITIEKPIDLQIASDFYSNIAAPMVIHFGYITPSKNIKLYFHGISALAKIIEKKCQEKPKINSSGIIINTCGWVKQLGYTTLTHIAKAFETDIIIVLDQERLYNELKKDMPSFVKIALLPKSGGVVSRSKVFRSNMRDKRTKEYFYGTDYTVPTSLQPDISLLKEPKYFPHSFELKFNEVKIYKIGKSANEILPDSCLPVGMKLKDQNLSVYSVNINLDLLHHIVSISHSPSESEEDILNSNVAGFLCITDIKMEKETFIVLSPQPKPLPNNILLISELQFLDYT